MAHDVFISYASKDKIVADAVCAALEADRIRCYIAPRDVLPGQRYAQALVDAIHNARAFVLVFSAASNASNQVEREVDRAVSCGLPILPLRVEDVIPSDWLEYYLAGQHWLDALTPPLEAHLSRLSEAIGVLLQPPATGGAPPITATPPGDESGVAAPSAAAEPAAAAAPPAERPPVRPRPMEYVPPRAAVRPVEAARPTEAVKPAVAEPSAATRPPDSGAEPAPAAAKPVPAAAAKPTPPPRSTATAAAATPVLTRPASATAKPIPTPATASAAAAPAVPPKVVAAAAPAHKGRRTAVIAAAVVGASWIGVLLAVELLFR